MIREHIDLLTLSLRIVCQPTISRTTNQVIDEYDGSWRKYQTVLNNAATLDEWLYIREVDDAEGLHNESGKLKGDHFNSTDFYRRQILEALNTHFPRARSITEYGCGVGRNLLYLKQSLPQLDCYGYELCPSGVKIAREAAQKFGMPAQYQQLDYVLGLAPDFIFPATDVAFTMFSLEQICFNGDKALANILPHSRQGSIHLEPIPEDYPFNYRGIMGRIYSFRMGYLQGFPRQVRSLGIGGITRKTLHTAHNPLMYPSVYVLKK